ncbi:MAG TPA: hypothetical protein VEY68_02365 [Anoxybacillus sp.]|nr:hypothetical protein [Anoxybacillus sp.]
MHKYIVVFKSGAKKEFYSTSVKTKSNGLTCQLVELEFNRDGKIRPILYKFK